MFTQNSKLKKEAIFGFGLCPGLTCCKCNIKCYALKGSYVQFHATGQKVWDHNLSFTKSGKFTTEMATYLWHKNIKHVRIHPEGDFYSQEYLDKWIRVAKLCPDVVFYAYTKRHDLNWSRLPSNFIKLQSIGGEFDSLVDYSKAHVKVFKTEQELVEAGYVNCSNSDKLAISSIKIGLVEH